MNTVMPHVWTSKSFITYRGSSQRSLYRFVKRGWENHLAWAKLHHFLFTNICGIRIRTLNQSTLISSQWLENDQKGNFILHLTTSPLQKITRIIMAKAWRKEKLQFLSIVSKKNRHTSLQKKHLCLFFKWKKKKSRHIYLTSGLRYFVFFYDIF